MNQKSDSQSETSVVASVDVAALRSVQLGVWVWYCSVGRELVVPKRLCPVLLVCSRVVARTLS